MPVPDFAQPLRPVFRHAMQWTQSSEYQSQYLYWSTARPVLIDLMTQVGYLILVWWALCCICRFLGLQSALRRSLLLAVLSTNIVVSWLQMTNPLKPWVLLLTIPPGIFFLSATFLSWWGHKMPTANGKFSVRWLAFLEPAAAIGLSVLAVLLFAAKRLVVFEYPVWWQWFATCSLLTLLGISIATIFAMYSAWRRSRDTGDPWCRSTSMPRPTKATFLCQPPAGEGPPSDSLPSAPFSSAPFSSAPFSSAPLHSNKPQFTPPVSMLPPLQETHREFFRTAAQYLIWGSMAISVLGWWPTGWGIDPNGIGSLNSFTRLQFSMFSLLWWFAHGAASLIFLLGFTLQQLAGLTIDRFGRLIANYLAMALVIPLVLQVMAVAFLSLRVDLLR